MFDITIDDVKPKESNLATNQEMLIILNIRTYNAISNGDGIAEFINTRIQTRIQIQNQISVIISI